MRIKPTDENSYPELPIGRDLITTIEHFRLFYQNWHTEYPNNCYFLQLIHRLAEMASTGDLLTPEREKKAVAAIEELQDDLYSAKIRHSEVAERGEHILKELSTSTPKSKLVEQIFRIEKLLSEHQIQEEQEAKTLIGRILSQISPTEEMHIKASSQELAKFLTQVVKKEDLLPCLKKIASICKIF